jgi:hypothetical protein
MTVLSSGAVALALTLVIACSAGEGMDAGGDGGGSAGASGKGTGGSAGDNTGGTGASTGGGGSGGSIIDPFETPCMGGRDAGRTPIRRLSRLEYGNIVADVFGDTSGRAATFVPEERVRGFASNSVSPVTELAIEQYHGAATAIAGCVVGGTGACTAFGTLSGCANASDTACVESFITTTARRLFRGTLPEAERTRLLELHRTSVTELDATDALTLSLQAMLLSPRFLYVVEFGDEGSTEALVPLTPSEVAGRMALSLWRSAPDAALLDAADSGALATPDGVRTEARRMLTDAKAERMFADYVRQWLQIERLDQASFQPSDFPDSWPEGFADWPALRAALANETLTFFSRASRFGGTLPEVLTANFTFSAETADMYGASWDAASGRSTLPAERPGILLQGSVLAAHSHPTYPAPVFRGKLVRERLLCQEMPPPLPDVDMNTMREEGQTTRALFDAQLDDPDCQGCHVQMNPIGNGFGAFNAIGVYEPMEEGQPVDTRGEVVDAKEASGMFEGAAELVNRLATSPSVGKCYTVQSFRYLLGRNEALGDVCAIQGAYDSFVANGQNITELLVSMVSSDTFRYRRKTQAGGACE